MRGEGFVREFALSFGVVAGRGHMVPLFRDVVLEGRVLNCFTDQIYRMGIPARLRGALGSMVRGF